MAEIDKRETLRQMEFLEDVSDAHLDKLVALAEVVQFPAQATIFREHERAKDVYLVVSGEVSLAICAPRVACRQIGTVHHGEMMGWSPLFGRQRLSDTAVAMTPVVAIRFDGGKLLDLCCENPEFGFDFMRRAAQVLVQRLNATRLLLLETAGLRLPEVQIESD